MNLRRSLPFLFLLFSLISLPAQQNEQDSISLISRIADGVEREAALRERLSRVESLEGRLSLLDDAAGYTALEESSRRIRVELLLLAGRTEEAEALLDPANPGDARLRLRLEITHGKRDLPALPGALVPDSPELSVPDRRTIDERAGREGVTPENLAARRGMLISTGILFSPYSLSETDEKKEDKKEPQGRTSVIQVGAFSREANALAHVDYLLQRGVEATIQRVENADSSTVYKTVISGIPSDTVQHELIRLKEKGIEGFILH
jgi:SPOR domain